MKALPASFYLRDDVLVIARELIGKTLVTKINGIVTSGLIVETEAYAGFNDRASHAYGGRRTSRNEAMYGPGGNSYVYLCYGIHRLFNVVTNVRGIPHAVLIRGIVPVEGITEMERRRNLPVGHTRFSSGPGTLTQALGIGLGHNCLSLRGDVIRICQEPNGIREEDIRTTPRIGVDYAGDDAQLPYRFVLDEATIMRTRKAVIGFT